MWVIMSKGTTISYLSYHLVLRSERPGEHSKRAMSRIILSIVRGWAATLMIRAGYRYAPNLWSSALLAVRARQEWKNRLVAGALVIGCAVGGQSACKRLGLTDPDPPAPNRPVPITGRVLEGQNSAAMLPPDGFTANVQGEFDLRSGDVLRVVTVNYDTKFLLRLVPKGTNPTNTSVGRDRGHIFMVNKPAFPYYEGYVDISIQRSDHGIDESTMLTRIALDSGGSVDGISLAPQNLENGKMFYLRFERLTRAGDSQAAMPSLFDGLLQGSSLRFVLQRAPGRSGYL